MARTLKGLLGLVASLVFLAAGLVAAASLAVVFVALLGVAAVRMGWARLAGRPVAPFVFRVDPRRGFERVYRARRRGHGDVTDVEPK
jgi:hypothetical protein